MQVSEWEGLLPSLPPSQCLPHGRDRAMPPRERAKRDSIIQCQFNELGDSREGREQGTTADSGGRHFFRGDSSSERARVKCRNHTNLRSHPSSAFSGWIVIDFGDDPHCLPSSGRRANCCNVGEPCNALLHPRFHACLFPARCNYSVTAISPCVFLAFSPISRLLEVL